MLLKYRCFKLLATEALPPTGHPQHIYTNLSSFTDGPERNIASRTGPGRKFMLWDKAIAEGWGIETSVGLAFFGVIPIQVHYCLIFKQATQPVRMDQRSRAPGTPAIPDKINIKKGAGRDFGSRFDSFQTICSLSLPLLFTSLVNESLCSLVPFVSPSFIPSSPPWQVCDNGTVN